ncbi:hypothetical protein, partial [Escherichia coli]|uniref:hypothetical protein n=1 Tax=Escherichia coli TaxID=562 RepID=UPI0013B373B6
TDIIATPAQNNGNLMELRNQIHQLPEVAESAIVTDTMLDAEFAASLEGDSPMTVAAWSPELGSALRTGAVIPEPEPGTIILPPTPET